jgi:sugar/nucleoside kinase (ribokinase family)
LENLLVIGGASSDILHLKDRTVTCAGGAGMYVAMAARRCGVKTVLFGPRPEPYPAALSPVAARLTDWLGPAIPQAQGLHFEIDYRGEKTEYLNYNIEAELALSPEALPADLSAYDLVHVGPLGEATKQLSFIRACRQRGARRVSAGTGLFIAEGQPEIVQAIVAETDVFFMNEREHQAVFGALEDASTRPGHLLYVTLGEQGAFVVQGDTRAWVPAVPTEELDPTGAGDAFCGATLAFLLQDHHPVMAARRAVTLAAEMIARVGPEALLSDAPAPEAALDPRVRVNAPQVRQVAAAIATLPEVTPFSFIGPVLPPAGHPRALEFFFAGTLQQFGFWTVRDGRYERPLIAGIGGSDLKGSDYLWASFLRRIEQDPTFCAPERQASLSRAELEAVFRADSGEMPMPALDIHLEEARRYGRDMLALGLTPQQVLDEAMASAQPLRTFLARLDQIGGYKEDPLRKKSSLLALILNQRPERFLPLRRDEHVEPVIDYHGLRTCLRVGLIDVVDEVLHEKLRDRRLISAEEEWAVRYAAYRSRQTTVTLSGKSEGAVDWFFFSARKRCPEMTEPVCELCQIDPVCAHRKALFQPVWRTTYY